MLVAVICSAKKQIVNRIVIQGKYEHCQNICRFISECSRIINVFKVIEMIIPCSCEENRMSDKV